MGHGGDEAEKTHAKLRAGRRRGAFEMSFTRVRRWPLIAAHRVNSRRIIISLYVVVLAALSVATGAVFLDARAQYRQLKQMEMTNRQKLAEARVRLQEQERTLERLKTDPEFIERAIRERLKYAKPGEMIYRFEN